MEPINKVFSPISVLTCLYNELLISKQVSFKLEKVLTVNSKISSVSSNKSGISHFDFIFNVSGYGALKLYQDDSLRAKSFPFSSYR